MQKSRASWTKIGLITGLVCYWLGVFYGSYILESGLCWSCWKSDQTAIVWNIPGGHVFRPLSTRLDMKKGPYSVCCTLNNKVFFVCSRCHRFWTAGTPWEAVNLVGVWPWDVWGPWVRVDR